MTASLYFIAIIPPADICEEITAIKKDFAARFNSRHALRLIPHITLKAPFALAPASHEAALRWFVSLDVPRNRFVQRLNNFGCFANKRNPVIFIEPVLEPPLQHLQQRIVASFRETFPGVPVPQNEAKFHPHMTVAYRDLSYAGFKKAWEEYRHKQYVRSFTVDNFSLLQHDQKQWNIVATSSLE